MKTLSIIIALFSIAFGSFAQKNKQPNVIVILADDLGTGDISHYRKMHSDTIILETPNIDLLANQGMVFTNAHSPAALCATSRYAIMTGNSCYRSTAGWGVWGGYSKPVIRENQLTLGRLMKQANYNTAFIGKWHIGTGFPQKDNPEHLFISNRQEKRNPRVPVDITKIKIGPKQLGFDYSLSLPAGIQNVPYAIYENHEWLKLRENSEIKVIDQDYYTKLGVDHFNKPGWGDSNWDPSEMGPLLAKKGVEYIAKHAKQEKPFFMYYCSQAVHTPHAPPAEINGVKIKGSTPSKHLDMVKELDEQVGLLIRELKKQGILNNTVIVFTSDNGGLGPDIVPDSYKAGHQPSDIYRGAKNLPYEGGHRVPFIVSWPKEIKKKQSCDKPIIGMDIMATLAAITQQNIEKTVAQDSHNLMPVLKNEKGAKTHDFLMIQGGADKEYIINDKGWKLIMQVNKKTKDYLDVQPIGLFNINNNITEEESGNFINNPEYKNKVDALLRKYKKTIKSQVYLGSH
ncbi:sulfatase family protein [Saccharicrinis aurantiacus]|uniref:sulfatase family protein n=1 Tax=Saccharicrinis aurantiacus TaxID=1849719 RepID=UPI00094F5CE0|nr:arylsulfatase [Saccharicrinis aurantiacus]